MQEPAPQSNRQSTSTAWRSVVNPIVWLLLACIPLVIVKRLQQQSNADLASVKSELNNEQIQHSTILEQRQLAQSLAKENWQFSEQTKQFFSECANQNAPPPVDSPLPMMFSHSDDCWIWLPPGKHQLNFCSKKLETREYNMAIFQQLPVTARFELSDSGWYQLKFSTLTQIEEGSGLKVDFINHQSKQIETIPLGLDAVSSSGQFSDSELVVWPNRIPKTLVKDIHGGSGSGLLENRPIQYHRCRFDFQNQTVYCCFSLKCDLAEDSTKSLYQGDVRQLEKSILESYRNPH